ncbi:MAG: hypothetical protein E7413_00985 [Ruminococcaceae bacterium]|nr:hypothetical protein [Oscillospiraceae bacterium]
MGFRKNAFAIVFDVSEGKNKTKSVRLAISRKRKDTDPPVYEQEFGGYCTFIGNANAKAEKLKERDSIRLGEVDVTNWYNKEKNKTYTTYKVFDFEFCDEFTSSSSTPKKTEDVENETEEGEPEEERLPF